MTSKKSKLQDALVELCLRRDGPNASMYIFTNDDVAEKADFFDFKNKHDVTHIDTRQGLSPLMKKHDLCLFHLGSLKGEESARHCLLSPSDLAFHDFENIDEKDKEDLDDLKPGPLDETNSSESNILSLVYNHGILDRFLYGGDRRASPQIYMSHRSRKNTKHRVGDISLPTGKIQFEVDMTFAYDGKVTIFVGKNWKRNRDNFAIYQLYMPYRHYEIMSRERPEIGIENIDCCYLIRRQMSWGSEIFAYLYTFDDPEDLTSIRFIKNAQFNLIYRGRKK
ncbi:MAG: hypothetical protein VX514_06300 [Candidatus Thermoplasmatota archaeon]|nr:hypothetical protein [Candidatus Thermoplasmatota archaeon]